MVKRMERKIFDSHGMKPKETVGQGSQQAVSWGQREHLSVSSSPPVAPLEADEPAPGTTQKKYALCAGTYLE